MNLNLEQKLKDPVLRIKLNILEKDYNCKAGN